METVTKERREEIISITRDLNEDFEFPEIPITKLAKHLNVEIKTAEFAEPNVTGLLFYGDKSKGENPKIFVNIEHPPQKQNITIAHEIGHLLIHKPDKDKKYKIDRIDYQASDKKIVKEEIEADFFASHLLVPDNKLQRVLSKLGTAPRWYIDDFCSRYFNVPRGVIMNRLIW